MRYKAIVVNIMLIFFGFFIAMSTLMTLYFVHLNSIAVVGTCLVLSFPYFFQYGNFQDNVIQFGVDQLSLHHLKR